MINFILIVLLASNLNIFTSSQNHFKINDQRNDSTIIEGDIKVRPGVTKSLLNTGSPRWTNGIVYYTISPSVFSTNELAMIYLGMRTIENQTRSNGIDCIKFVERTTQTNYVRIISDSGCYSYVGMIGGVQDLSLEKVNNKGHCIFNGIIMHEFLHALGFHHEQSRADRDNYVIVNLTNIQPASISQFEKKLRNYDYQNEVYDLDSVMHYSSYAFSSNGFPTILTRSGAIIPEHFNDEFVSNTDVTSIRKAYGCSITTQTTRGASSSTKSVCNLNCLNDGFCVLVNNFPSCQCPSGYTGSNCETSNKPTTYTPRTTTIETNSCTDSQANCFAWINNCPLLINVSPHPCRLTCKICTQGITLEAVSTTRTATKKCENLQRNCSFWALFCRFLTNSNPHPCEKTCRLC